jgi:hypothetical protein
VRHVEANPITASVLLLIEPGQGIELESVSGGLFSLRSDRARQELFGRKRRSACGILTGRSRDLLGEVDLLSLAFAGLLAMGIYQLSIGNIAAPAWYVAFWYRMIIVFSGHPSEMIASQVVEETREKK